MDQVKKPTDFINYYDPDEAIQEIINVIFNKEMKKGYDIRGGI